MKYPKCNNWEDFEYKENLLFFVQRILEVTNDFTCFEYRIKTLSVQGIVKEIIQLIRLYKKRNLNEKNKELDILIQELILQIKSIKIYKNILGIKFEYLIKEIESYSCLDSLDSIIKILSALITRNKIIEDLIPQLKKEIVEGRKSKIDLLTTEYIKILLESGYMQGTIYYLTIKHFFGNDKIDSLENYESYVEYFDFKVEKYQVYISINKSILHIEENIKRTGIQVITDKSDFDRNSKGKKFLKLMRRSDVIIRIDVNALDYQSARKNSIQKLDSIKNIFMLNNHRTLLSWRSLTLVNKKEKWVLIDEPTQPLKKMFDDDITGAKHYIDLHLNNFKFRDATSRSRYLTVLELHASAIRNEDLDSKLLNVWIALETLFVSRDDASKFEKVRTAILPFVLNQYIESTIEYVRMSLLKNKITSEISNDELCQLLALIERKDEMIELMGKMDSYPLLRYRLYELIKNIQKVKDLTIYKEKTSNELVWILRRIYRERNFIVHIGKKQKNDTLNIENAHYFLDYVLLEIMSNHFSENNFNSLESIFDHQNLIHRINQSQLAKYKNDSCTKDSYQELLLI